MKATGIVRRIDDLGRVVVPKEIRRTLGIREGTPLEIFTGKDGEVILKKYSPLGEIYTFAQNYAESLSQASGVPGSYGRRCDRRCRFFVAGRGEGSIQGNLSEACPVCCHISRKSDGSIVIKRKPASYNSLRNRTRRMR